jgi:hypothetical protein
MENIEQSEPERHTEEIQDIITKVPSWVMRWGIMVFFGVLLIVVAISAIVRYPDVVKSRISFQSVEKDVVIVPGPVVVKQVAVNPNAAVKQGQLLAVVTNAGGEHFNIISTIDGTIGFAAIVQPGAFMPPQQPMFVIHPRNQHYFGLMQIPVSVSGPVKTGQLVLISTGDKTDGQLTGKINAITDEPDKTGLVTVKVILNGYSPDLKSWMIGNAQILTKNISVGERIWNSVVKKM